jgi:methanogenic corrinoid protein MtbC1
VFEMADTRRLMVSLGFSGNMGTADAEGLSESRPRPGKGGSLLVKRLAGLAGIVEDEVVPRLVESHRARRSAPPQAAIPDEPEALLDEPQAGVVDRLAELVVADGAAARAYVQAIHDDGMSIEAIYLNVLAPTARLLGKYWETDERHFAEVTIGVGLLQQMLHDFEAAFQADAKAWQPALRVLLMPAPHEQHTFGLFMIGEFMRRAGWDAWTGPLPTAKELKPLMRSGGFGVVGFSASSDSRLDDLSETIAMVRRETRGRPLCVMVGGYVFAADPALVAKVGADGTANNARDAIRLAHRLVGDQIGRP